MEFKYGKYTTLAKPKNFNVKRIRKGVLKNPYQSKKESLIEDFIEFDVDYNVISRKFDKAKMKLSKFDNAIRYVDSVSSEISENIRSLNNEMNKLNALINGNKSKAEPGEKDDPSIYDRVSIAMRGLYGNTYGPTKGQLKSYEIAKKQWSEAKPIIENFVKNVNKTSDLIEKIGSPKIID